MMSKYVKSVVVFTLGILATMACAAQGGAKDQSKNPIVAKVGNREITSAELEKRAAGQLMRVRQQMYEVKKKALEDYIDEILLEEKAKSEGISTEEWLKKNLDSKIVEPTEEEIKKVMEQYRSRLAKDDDQARNQVVTYLRQKSRQDAEHGLKQVLRKNAGIQILLEPPRMEPVIMAHNPTRGPADAPVTLVEYTDFQCPYCGRAQETLETLRARYGDKLRMVFKNMPLQMHPNSHFAAEAALCAKDQGKFWEMHDWLFSHHNELEKEKVYAQAKEMGLDVEAMKTCVDKGTHNSDIDKDVEEAQSFGITGTPGFVINGRLITGAQPVENFEEIINEELSRKGVEIPSKVEKPTKLQSAQPVKKGAVGKAAS